MGNKALCEASTDSSSSACPIRAKPTTQTPPLSCPVKFGGGGNSPHTTQSQSTTTSSTSNVGEDKKYVNPNQYNVYSQKIDPTNQMPSTANQLPAENQQVPLSTQRVTSNIPKGGTEDSSWVYPSPQMFWNALVRKNKTEGASENDMETVIAVHNNMNETTWKQVLSWEALHPPPQGAAAAGCEPKLLRFLGRPDDPSPRARLKALFGHPLPFDRHDWVVDRGGREVRYVIDYYHDESKARDDNRPTHLHDTASIKSIIVDVRPALDSLQSFIDRLLRMPALQSRSATVYKPPPFFPPPKMILAESVSKSKLVEQWRQIQLNCAADKDALLACTSEQDCGAASVKLQRCTASVVCPEVAAAFDSCVTQTPPNGEKLEIAYSAMQKCLEMFEIDSRKHM